jgi:hypothetical protein
MNQLVLFVVYSFFVLLHKIIVGFHVFLRIHQYRRDYDTLHQFLKIVVLLNIV